MLSAVTLFGFEISFCVYSNSRFKIRKTLINYIRIKDSCWFQICLLIWIRDSSPVLFNLRNLRSRNLIIWVQCLQNNSDSLMICILFFLVGWNCMFSISLPKGIWRYYIGSSIIVAFPGLTFVWSIFLLLSRNWGGYLWSSHCKIQSEQPLPGIWNCA